MKDFFIGLMGAMLATNQVTQISNLVATSTGIALPVVEPTDPLETEFRQLLIDDDAAQDEVDQWIRQDLELRGEAPNPGSITLTSRIDRRLDEIRARYKDFLERHPDFARARLAYGSFLNDIGEAEAAREQWERARTLEPDSPSAWNNLADYYSHFGPVAKSFEYLAKAIELRPSEPVYHQNLATLVFLFRKDAREIYGLSTEREVFLRSLSLYDKALALDPANFPLATERAQVYYFLEPEPSADASAKRALQEQGLQAWGDAMALARTDLQQEGVRIHLARLCIGYERYDEAARHLSRIREPALQQLKEQLERNLRQARTGG